MKTFAGMPVLTREPLDPITYVANSTVQQTVKLIDMGEYPDERIIGIFLKLEAAGLTALSENARDLLLNTIRALSLKLGGIFNIEERSGEVLAWADRLRSLPGEYFNFNYKGEQTNATSIDLLLPLFRANPALSGKDGFPASVFKEAKFSLVTVADEADALNTAPEAGLEISYRLQFKTVKCSRLTLGAPYAVKYDEAAATTAFSFPHNNKKVTVAAAAFDTTTELTASDIDKIRDNGKLRYPETTTVADIFDEHISQPGMQVLSSLYKAGLGGVDASNFDVFARHFLPYRKNVRLGDRPGGKLTISPKSARELVHIQRGRLNAETIARYGKYLGVKIDPQQLTIVAEDTDERKSWNPSTIFPVDTGIDTKSLEVESSDVD